jgi:hypothetical protein
MKMVKFEIGKVYAMKSPCYQDCVWVYTVMARTASTITLESEDGEVIKCRINKKDMEHFGAEAVRPLGTYSMCPILRANKCIN